MKWVKRWLIQSRKFPIGDVASARRMMFLPKLLLVSEYACFVIDSCAMRKQVVYGIHPCILRYVLLEKRSYCFHVRQTGCGMFWARCTVRSSILNGVSPWGLCEPSAFLLISRSKQRPIYPASHWVTEILKMEDGMKQSRQFLLFHAT